MEIKNFGDILKLNGMPESDEIEVKQELLSLENITKKIHSFINGEKKLAILF